MNSDKVLMTVFCNTCAKFNYIANFVFVNSTFRILLNSLKNIQKHSKYITPLYYIYFEIGCASNG